MKFVIFLPFVLLLGLLIGGWAPREALRATQKDLAEMSKKLASREKDSRMDTFTRMVKIPDRAKQHTHKPVIAASAAQASEIGGNGTNRPPLATTSTNATAVQLSAQSNMPVSPEDLRARIDEAKELWKTRVDIARAQWIQRLKLTTDATALFDSSINAMNEELYASMQGLADALANSDELTPELGTRFINEMTTSLVKTYDDINAIVPEEQQGESAKIELTDFIDPGVAEPLIAVQDKLDKLPGPGGRRSRGENK